MNFNKLRILMEIVNNIFSDENKKHLVEASKHVKNAAGEIKDASELVIELYHNIKHGINSRDLLTAEVKSMLPAEYDE